MINETQEYSKVLKELQEYIGEFKLLSHEETLWEFRKPLDLINSNKILNGNLKLVYKIASGYSKVFNYDLLELFNVGVLGLHRAIKLFNSTIKIKFSTYAYNWIKHYILDFIEHNITNMQSLSATVNDSNFDLSATLIAVEQPKMPLYSEILNTSEQEILKLWIYDGYSAVDIGKFKGITLRQVYYTQERIKNKLKKRGRKYVLEEFN